MQNKMLGVIYNFYISSVDYCFSTQMSFWTIKIIVKLPQEIFNHI